MVNSASRECAGVVENVVAEYVSEEDSGLQRYVSGESSTSQRFA